jgi:hypothetical protein
VEGDVEEEDVVMPLKEGGVEEKGDHMLQVLEAIVCVQIVERRFHTKRESLVPSKNVQNVGQR